MSSCHPLLPPCLFLSYQERTERREMEGKSWEEERRRRVSSRPPSSFFSYVLPLPPALILLPQCRPSPPPSSRLSAPLPAFSYRLPGVKLGGTEVSSSLPSRFGILLPQKGKGTDSTHTQVFELQQVKHERPEQGKRGMESSPPSVFVAGKKGGDGIKLTRRRRSKERRKVPSLHPFDFLKSLHLLLSVLASTPPANPIRSLIGRREEERNEVGDLFLHASTHARTNRRTE